jgi:hypothetical protein
VLLHVQMLLPDSRIPHHAPIQHTTHAGAFVPPTQRPNTLWCGAGLGVDLTSVSLPVHDPLDTAKPDLPPSPVLAVATSDAKLRVRNLPPPSVVRCHTALQSQHSCVPRCATICVQTSVATHGMRVNG